MEQKKSSPSLVFDLVTGADLPTKPQSATSIAISPDDERRSRMLRYTLAMTIRFACVILAVVIQGWLVWVFIAGAVLLPYFAVVLANAHDHSGNQKKQASAVAPTLTIGADAFTSSSK